MNNFENELKKLADKIAQSWRDENVEPEYARAQYANLSNKLGDMLFDRAVIYYREYYDIESVI